MPNNLKNFTKVLVVGSGYMATEYAKVLTGLNIEYEVVGRGVSNCEKMESEFSVKVHSGGIEHFLSNNILSEYSHIINTVNINFLNETTQSLINAGAEKILLEKPGDLNISGLKKISDLSKMNGAEVLIAYNRRFYSSIEKLKNLVKKDGGIKSIHFEFTEWIHTIKESDYDKKSLNKWIIANSSHVIDTVFYLIGNPKIINPNIMGKSKISWHPSGSIFTGSGISTENIPFTYHANWLSSGRWNIEILTNRRCFYLKPMEILQNQRIGSIKINKVKINDNIDIKYKPGLYRQTLNFTENNFKNFCTVEDQIERIKNIYNKIGNY
tara:strand:- start:7964 stop:8938 length:975 start_codon:yes stop_codon:yes gene_type:complete